MQNTTEIKIDRTKLTFSNSFDDPEEKEYWAARTAEERMQAMEMMRRVAFGYDEDSGRLQRILEFAERPRR